MTTPFGAGGCRTCTGHKPVRPRPWRRAAAHAARTPGIPVRRSHCRPAASSSTRCGRPIPLPIWDDSLTASLQRDRAIRGEVIRTDGNTRVRARGLAPSAMGRGRTGLCPVHVRSNRAAEGCVKVTSETLLQRVASRSTPRTSTLRTRLLTLASPCTIVGVRDVMTALLAGANIHLLDPQGVGAREILNVIHAETITILSRFRPLLRSIVTARRSRAGASLRWSVSAGTHAVERHPRPLRAWLLPQAAIQLIYAATEGR